jgi:pimeloyl-ACP methyl ester carboxylesterase
VPLLVLSSAGDQLVDPRCSTRLAHAWQAPHAIHPNGGHDLPLDDGPWVAQEVAKWLASAEAR